MQPIAVINSFANEYTTAGYFVEALNDMGVAYQQFHPKEQRIIPKDFAMRLYIDDGTHYCIYPDADVLKILYVIDTHTRLDLDMYMARFADAVFCAQFNAVGPLKRICSNTSWLPLGCSQKWHRCKNPPFQYDLAFIGGVNDPKREMYLSFLRKRYANRSFINRANKSNIGEIYSGSRIVFNISINNDINMRFFEALCSGALLITERIQNNGMERLLQSVDNPVCLFFDTLEEAVSLIDYYLEHEDERQAIAQRGKLFSESQTYMARTKTIFEECSSLYPKGANKASYLCNCAILDVLESGIRDTSGRYFRRFRQAIKRC
ncbi:glycosyltransferase family protein [Desulfomicrobium salsuginis]